MLSFAEIPPVCNQFEVHAYNQRQELIEFCEINNIVPMGYNVILKPPIDPYYHFNETALEDVVVISISSRIGNSPAQVLLK